MMIYTCRTLQLITSFVGLHFNHKHPLTHDQNTRFTLPVVESQMKRVGEHITTEASTMLLASLAFKNLLLS